MFSLFLLKIKDTVLYRNNFLLLAVLPLLAAACAWALLSFYIEGGAAIPVGVIDFDNTGYSKIVLARFLENESVKVTKLTAIDGIDSDIGFVEITEDVSMGSAGEVRTGADEESVLAGAVRMIQRGRLEAVVVIQDGFSEQLKNSEPDGVYQVICAGSGIVRGLVTELFAAEVSRVYFNCDAASRVLSNKLTELRRARLPAPSDEEQTKIWEEAFMFSDSYWEPEPLMTIDYGKYVPDAGTSPSGSLDADEAADGYGGARDLLNEMIARGVFALFFTYAAFCVLNASQSLVKERESGIIDRLRAGGLSPTVWISVSAAAPFLLYGITASALLYVITGEISKTLFAVSSLFVLSFAGATLSYAAKTNTFCRLVTFVMSAAALAASLTVY